MTDFLVSDAMDAAESLLQAVWIPSQVVVHHQVRVLQIDAFAGSVGRKKDAHIWIGAEESL